jgi:hemolysin activation/secretion protein
VPNNLKLISAFAIAFLLSTNTFAIPPLGGFLPGAARPEQVGKALTTEQPKPLRAHGQPLQRPEQATPALSEEMKKVKFKLNGVILTGNHVYSDAQLSVFYQDKLHKEVTIAEIFTILQNITNFYRNNGYILSRAILPQQQVANGVIKFQIIEGYIGKVTVSGKPLGAKCLVQAFGNKISECRPTQISRMEKYLILANEIPGVQVRAVLEASKDKKPQLGSADLTLATETRQAMGYFSYDNYGTRYIGPQQMTGNFQFNSLITSGDAGQVTMTKTPKGGELNFIDMNYNMALTAEGTRLLLGGTRTHTHPLFVLRPAQIDGLNDNYYTTVSYPMIRTRSESFTLRTGFNYLDSTVTTIADAQLYTDHVRSLDLGGTYSFSDRWYGSNVIGADFRQGLPILGYTSNQNPDTAQTSRPGGRGDYTKIAMTASRLQVIKGPVSLFGQVQGQWAFNPVLASEQFAFGGPQLGRGYDIAEILGDKGLAGSLELRYDWGIQRFLIQSLQLYTFYDVGSVWDYKFVGGVPRTISATSTGLGVRFYMNKYINGNLMWTQTLTKQVAAMEFIGEGRRPRVWFSIVASFG